MINYIPPTHRAFIIPVDKDGNLTVSIEELLKMADDHNNETGKQLANYKILKEAIKEMADFLDKVY